MTSTFRFTAAVLSILFVFTASAGPEEDVDALLSAMHEASKNADVGYFDLFADDAVFFGTDLWERWTKDEFEALYRPYMESGRGWEFTRRDRRIDIQPCGTIALFDESLSSESFGPCRGSGAARLEDGVWKLVRYHLDITIPNGVVDEVVGVIEGYKERRLEILFGDIQLDSSRSIGEVLREYDPDLALFVVEGTRRPGIDTGPYSNHPMMVSSHSEKEAVVVLAAHVSRFGDMKGKPGDQHPAFRPDISVIDRSSTDAPPVELLHQWQPQDVTTQLPEHAHFIYIGPWTNTQDDPRYAPLEHDGMVFDAIMPANATVEEAKRITVGENEIIRAVIVFADE